MRADERLGPSNEAKQIGMPVQKRAVNAGCPGNAAYRQRFTQIGELLDRRKHPVISAFGIRLTTS